MDKGLKIKGKAVAFIDWANVFGWEKSLKKKIDIRQLFTYLKTYPQIDDIRMYFGQDKHEKSRQFLQEAEAIGYTTITKPVKYILLEQIAGQKIYRRKCDEELSTEEREGKAEQTGKGDINRPPHSPR